MWLCDPLVCIVSDEKSDAVLFFVPFFVMFLVCLCFSFWPKFKISLNLCFLAVLVCCVWFFQYVWVFFLPV